MKRFLFTLLLITICIPHGWAQLLASAGQPAIINEGYHLPLAVQKKPAPKPNTLMIVGGCAMVVGAVADVAGLVLISHDYDAQTETISQDQLAKGHAFEAAGTIVIGAGLTMVIVGIITNKNGHPHRMSVVAPRRHELGIAWKL